MRTCALCGADGSAVVLMFNSPLERDLVCVDHVACRLRESARMARPNRCIHCDANGETSQLFPVAVGENGVSTGAECWNRAACRMRVVERELKSAPGSGLYFSAESLMIVRSGRLTPLACAPRPA